MKNFVLIGLLFGFSFVKGQETIGLIFNDSNVEKSSGYTLIKPTSDTRTFLINNCGEVMNEWTFSGVNSRNSYLLENGNLLQSSTTNAEIKDWNNNLLWSLDYQSVFGWTIHHDIEPLPNGNFLVLVRDIYQDSEMFALGQSNAYVNAVNVLERILEIQPLGTNSANIVWEWRLIDHIIQDVDSSKPNFGVVADNPQLYNINYVNGNGANPIHANAIDYNEELDQIIVSARHLSEVFVIDHSTTTSEAASHSGGIYGQGGDFLWRWGNPEVYNQGTNLDRTLGRQHDIKWIEYGPDAGKFSVFSNDGFGFDLTGSSVHIIDANHVNGFYALDSGKFVPSSYQWSWNGTIMAQVMHASAQSGFQVLPNGNALINESDIGRITEITSSGEIIWVYRIPVGGGQEFTQFTEPIGNGAFRAHKYPEDYLAFNNVTFNNLGILEDENSISQNCIDALSIENLPSTNLVAYPNPTKDVLNFKTNTYIDKVDVYDLSGKLVLSRSNTKLVNLKILSTGFYVAKITSGDAFQFIKISKK